MRYYTDISLQAIATTQIKCDVDPSWTTLAKAGIFLTDLFEIDMAINSDELIPDVSQDLIIGRQFLFGEIIRINKLLDLLYDEYEKKMAEERHQKAISRNRAA